MLTLTEARTAKRLIHTCKKGATPLEKSAKSVAEAAVRESELSAALADGLGLAVEELQKSRNAFYQCVVNQATGEIDDEDDDVQVRLFDSLRTAKQLETLGAKR